MGYDADKQVQELNRYGGDSIGQRARSPRCECSVCVALNVLKETYLPAVYSDYDSIDPEKDEHISDQKYLLCQSHMYGFVLKDRLYGKN